MRAEESPASSPHPSQIIGSYLVDEPIASGGMGTVYRASHTVLPRRAAIKVLHAHMIGTQSATTRMLQEARILAAIDHPTVVKVYDAGVLGDGRPWVAMELCDGQTLADHLLVHHRLPPREVARVAVALAEALLRAHRAGIVHRDVKPENVMLVAGARGPAVKLIDWGIAHDTATAERLTQHDYSPGTPCYMAPEQLRAQPIDGRADTYALGVVLYEMLAGELPFDGPNPYAIALKTLHDPVPYLSAQLEVPARIEGLVRAMMGKKPSARPSLEYVRATFAEWARELDGDEELEVEIEVELSRDCVSGEITC
jgi:serine/threonine-protein kinase